MKIRKNGKVINLTESDLRRIVKRVLNENEEEYPDIPGFEKKLPKEPRPPLGELTYTKEISGNNNLGVNDELFLSYNPSNRTFEITLSKYPSGGSLHKEIYDKLSKYGSAKYDGQNSILVEKVRDINNLIKDITPIIINYEN